MKTIEIMMEEHENIRRLLRVIREITYDFMESKPVDFEDFYRISDFIKNYGDEHHHRKEEKILFMEMEKASAKLKNSGAILGMLIEHDNGRLYNMNLVEALEDYKAGNDYAKLDIVANLISYSHLLDRHIEKENTAIYVFGEKVLSEDTKEKIDREALALEAEADKSGFKENYLDLLVSLEEKYLK